MAFGLGGADAFDALEVIDAAGRRVRRWAGRLPATVTWDGHDDDGRVATAGVYWVRGMRAGRPLTRRMVRIAR